MIYVLAVLALVALGFGLGRVKHPANLKLSKIKAEVLQLELEGKAEEKAVVARIKSLL